MFSETPFDNFCIDELLKLSYGGPSITYGGPSITYDVTFLVGCLRMYAEESSKANHWVFKTIKPSSLTPNFMGLTLGMKCDPQISAHVPAAFI